MHLLHNNSTRTNQLMKKPPPMVAAKGLASLARHAFLNVHYMASEYQGDILRVIIADDGDTLHYMKSLIFPNGAKVYRRIKIPAFLGSNLIERRDIDLVVVGANHYLQSLYRRAGFYLLPRSVRLIMPLPKHPDDIIAGLERPARKSILRYVRRISASGYDYRVTTDPDWVDLFYYDMFKPYILHKYGKAAMVTSYKKVKRDYLSGFGIEVIKDGEQLAGTIVIPYGSTLYNPHGGVIHGDEELAREGASFALYYYAMLFAYSSGYTEIDFGCSRPFLSDGSLSFKLKWDMNVVPGNTSTGIFAIAAPGCSNQARKFLQANRFYHLHNEGIELVKGELWENNIENE
jgi:hypothetical protein